MTNETRIDGWDHARLRAAFVARERARPGVRHLIPTTLERLAAERRPRPARWVAGVRPALATISVISIVAIFAGLSYVSTRPMRLGPSDSVSTPSTPPAVTPAASTPQATAGPETALGLPIVSVSDAIAIRDAGVDNQELAVRGWYTPAASTPIFDCYAIGRLIQPVQSGCGENFIWLTQDREQTARLRKGSTEFTPPTGPAIHPSFDQLSPDWPTFALGMNVRLCGQSCLLQPVSIVAIGHFDDRRAALCAPQVRAQCQDRFVVDRVDNAAGQQENQPVTDTVGGDHVWTIDDIRRLDALDSSDSRLSVQVVSGRDKSLSIEPTIATDPAWSRQPAVWLVRDLIGGRLLTRVIADGSNQVFELRSDGTLAPHIDCRNTFCQLPAPTASPS
jgi:hypothetical protein